MTAPSQGNREVQRVTDAVEPLRMAVHAAAHRHPHGSARRLELVRMAADITVAETSLAEAVQTAQVALLLEPLDNI